MRGTCFREKNQTDHPKQPRGPKARHKIVRKHAYTPMKHKERNANAQQATRNSPSVASSPSHHRSACRQSEKDRNACFSCTKKKQEVGSGHSRTDEDAQEYIGSSDAKCYAGNGEIQQHAYHQAHSQCFHFSSSRGLCSLDEYVSLHRSKLVMPWPLKEGFIPNTL